MTAGNTAKLKSMRNQHRAAFSLVEMISVVAILTILTTGVVIGFKRQKDNVDFSKATRDLDAIDQAKTTWKIFHPTGTWPATEPERWAAITNWVGTGATGEESPASSGYYIYEGFSPAKYTYHIGEVSTPATGRYLDGGAYTDIRRPL